MQECEDLLSELQYKDISELRYNVPKQALQTKIKKATVLDYAKVILQIAEKSLKENQTGEELFLQAIKEYTLKGVSPADIIQKKWNTSWHKDLRKMMKYLNDINNINYV